MKQGRERAHLTSENAAMVLGMANKGYLSNCENGATNFPASKLKRAISLYKISADDVLEAVEKDFHEGAVRFLGEK